MKHMAGALKQLGLVAAGVLMALIPGSARADQPQPKQLRLDAFAVNLSGVGRAEAQRLEIVIERWSSDATRDKLIEALKDKGSGELLDALQSIKPRVGYIRTNSSLGWDIQYAQEYPLPEGGRRIVFATDRPMSFWEASARPRSSEYEFMLCEVRLNRDGTGEGKLAPMSKISFDKKKQVIEIENYGLEPIRLTQVTLEK